MVVNDPWDFVDADGLNVFHGQVLCSAREAGSPPLLLVRLDRPVVRQGSHSATFVVTLNTDAPTGGGIECQLFASDDVEVEGATLQDVVSGWRGGRAARATLRPARGVGDT